MKNSNLLILATIITICTSSCAKLAPTTTATTFQMQSEGESFDALTKITDLPNPCMAPFGGDSSKNLVFHSKDENGNYQMYLKENVLSPVVIKKTFSDANNAWGKLSPDKQKLVYQSSAGNGSSILYVDTYKGKAVAQVLSNSENFYTPSFSPDGKLIIVEKGARPRSYTFGTVTTPSTAAVTTPSTAVTKGGIKAPPSAVNPQNQLVGSCVTISLIGLLTYIYVYVTKI